MLIQCIAYQMHCLSNVLVIQWLLSTADAHTPSRSRSRYIGIWHICLQHGRRTHRRLTRRAGRATPLWHSSPGVCGCAGEREGVFSAMQCIGHGTQRRSNVLATPAPPHPSPGCGHSASSTGSAGRACKHTAEPAYAQHDTTARSRQQPPSRLYMHNTHTTAQHPTTTPHCTPPQP